MDGCSNTVSSWVSPSPALFNSTVHCDWIGMTVLCPYSGRDECLRAVCDGEWAAQKFFVEHMHGFLPSAAVSEIIKNAMYILPFCFSRQTLFEMALAISPVNNFPGVSSKLLPTPTGLQWRYQVSPTRRFRGVGDFTPSMATKESRMWFWYCARMGGECCRSNVLDR